MTLSEMCRRLALLFYLGFLLPVIEAQDNPQFYGAKNTFGVIGEYSNDSSHIALGRADNVKLGAIGAQYQRRLIANRSLVFSYAMEFRPVLIQSNPVSTVTTVQTFPTYRKYVGEPELTTKCVVGGTPYSYKLGHPPVIYSGAFFTSCGRRINYSQGLAPIGMRLNLRPRSRLQPTFSTIGGYLFSTKPLPVATAGSFNFAFELGAGLEYYRTPHSSVRLEYQLHHYSNDYTAQTNPGVDNGIVKLTYSFGR